MGFRNPITTAEDPVARASAAAAIAAADQAYAAAEAAEESAAAVSGEVAAAQTAADNAATAAAAALAQAQAAAATGGDAQTAANAAANAAAAAAAAAATAGTDAAAADAKAAAAAADAAQAIADAQAADAKAASAITDAATAQATADGKVTTYFQTAAPTGLTAGDVGDLWFDTDDGNRMYRWTGAAWTAAPDSRIATALSTAQAKIVTFYQAAAPATTGRTTGDLWVDTDDGNRLYRWSGSAWVKVAQTALDTATTGQRVRITEQGGVDGGGLVELYATGEATPGTLQAGSATDGANVALTSPPNFLGLSSSIRLTGVDSGDEGVWIASTGAIYLAPTTGDLMTITGTAVWGPGYRGPGSLPVSVPLTGATNYGSPFRAWRVWMQADGVTVQSEGLIRLTASLAAGATSPVLGTLPVGYRPPTEHLLTCVINGQYASRMDVKTDGTVRIYNFTPGAPTYPANALIPVNFSIRTDA